MSNVILPPLQSVKVKVDFTNKDLFYLPDFQGLKFSTNLLLISSCFKKNNCIFANHKIRHKTE
jgi:hypothetical protein